MAIIILLAAFGIYYFVYAERQTAYFAHRDLRILRTVAGQIRDTSELRANIRKTFAEDQIPAVAESLFAQSVLRVFDQVLITDRTGYVVHSTKGVEQISSLDDLQPGSTFTKSKSNIKVQSLLPRGDHNLVVLHGDKYHLFTQPLRLKGGTTYVLAGLVSASQFNRESLTISYTLILAVLGALLLTVFAMPFLKLKLISSLHRVRLSDVLVLCVCAMCAVSVMTIALLDLVTYRRLRSECDAQLRNLSTDINAHVRREIDGALHALTYLDGSIAPKPGANEVIPGDLLNAPAVRAYPWFQSMFRIDDSGHIIDRWSAPRETNHPRGIGIDVGDRDYFKDVKFGRGWRGAAGPYALNSVQSLSTGETQAVIAAPAKRTSPGNLVAAGLGIPMLSLIDTVVAGDCRYVVVDDTGQVLFHSEPQRNLAENFFDETDHDRALRAAVVGRQNELLDIRYWGDDQRAFVAPVPGTPWTLITFRNKVLLRTLNVEMIMITVVFMIIYALGCAMTMATIALLRPRYRAPWLWPAANRAHEYRRLIYAFYCFAVAFVVSIYAIRPRELMIIALALPLIASLVVFLRLRRVHGPFAFAGASLLVIAVMVWIGVTVSSDAMMEPDLLWDPTLLRLVMLFAGAAGIVLALLPPLTARERCAILSTPRYVGLGGMLIVMLAILPTTAFFKAAYKVEVESFVKYGQLRIARLLEQRTDDLQAAKVAARSAEPLEARMRENLDVYYDFFFDTDVRRIGTPVAAAAECAHRFKPGLGPAMRAAVEASVLPSFLEPLLPQYSDDSVAMRELHHDSSRDDQWQWTRCGADLDLHVNGVRGPRTFVVSRLPHQGVQLAAFAPQRASLPYVPMFDADVHPPEASDEHELLTLVLTLIAAGFVVLMYVGVIFTMIKFTLHHVFLVDVQEPETLAADEQICATYGGNLMILARDRDAALKSVKRGDFFEVQLAELKSKPHESWARIMTAIDQEPPERGVLITDFDAPATSADFGKLKLQFLERLMTNHGRNVVAVTLISPFVVLDETADDPATHDRWHALLRRFSFQLHERRRKPRPASTPADQTLVASLRRFWTGVKSQKVTNAFDGSKSHAAAVIAREAGDDEFLQQIGAYLAGRDVRLQEQIYDELTERASAYYGSIWASCSQQEKIVLLNVATDGFVNAKDRNVLRRLMARDLVIRDPSLHVMNETFRRFVCKHDRQQIAAGLADESGTNAWDKLQRPLAISLACFAIFFFSTQREMFDVTMGVVTGLAGGIPAFLRVIGLFLDPRSAVKAASAR